MIEYINAQLNLWAEWERTGHTRLGYPGHAAFVTAMGGAGSSCAMSDDRGVAMSRAVSALPPELFAVVDNVYRRMKTCTADQIARHLGCHRDTLYARLHRAHTAILGSLNDLEAGIPVFPYAIAKTPVEKRRAAV